MVVSGDEEDSSSGNVPGSFSAIPQKYDHSTFQIRKTLNEHLRDTQADSADPNRAKELASKVLEALSTTNEASEKKLSAVEHMISNIYNSIRPYFVGCVEVNPTYLRLPPQHIANKDFYQEHMDVLKRKILQLGPAYPSKPHLIAIPNVRL